MNKQQKKKKDDVNNDTKKEYKPSHRLMLPTLANLWHYGYDLVSEDKNSVTMKCNYCGCNKTSWKDGDGKVPIYRCRKCDMSMNNRRKIEELQDDFNNTVNQTQLKLVCRMLRLTEQDLLKQRRNCTAEQYARFTSEINNIRMKIQRIEKDPEAYVAQTLGSYMSMSELRIPTSSIYKSIV